MNKYGYIIPDNYKGCINCKHILEECKITDEEGKLHIVCPRWEENTEEAPQDLTNIRD